MKSLFALATLLVLSLVCPAFCQEGPDIFPNEHTRKIARELDLKSIKEIRLYVHFDEQYDDIIVTDPQIIGLLIEGLKTANTTDFSNQVDDVEVIDKNDRTLLEDRFSMAYFPALSPELVKGLRAAGAAPRAWKEIEERAKAQQEMTERLLLFAPFMGLMALLTFFFFRRKD